MHLPIVHVRERCFHEIGQCFLIPRVGDLIPIASKLIQGQQNVGVNHIKRKSELDARKQTRYRSKASQHAALPTRDIVGEKLLEHLLQFSVGKGAGNHGNELNVLARQLAHGAPQIRNVERDRVNFSRKLLFPLRLVGGVLSYTARVHLDRT